MLKFENDDDGFLAWRDNNPDGYIVNSDPSPVATYIILHRSDCAKLKTTPRKGGNWTHIYVKWCASTIGELDDYFEKRTAAVPSPCGICKPRRVAGHPSGHLCLCGCEQEVSKPGNSFIHYHDGELRGRIGTYLTGESPELSRFSEAQIEWARRFPEIRSRLTALGYQPAGGGDITPCRWAFFANPNVYDIERAIANLVEDTWTVGTKNVTAGDWAIIWKGKGRGERRGIVALAEVLSEPLNCEAPLASASFWPSGLPSGRESRVRIRYHVPPLAPVWWEPGEDSPISSLSVSRATGGSVFNVTKMQWDKIVKALNWSDLDSPGFQEELESDHPDALDFDPLNLEDNRTRALAAVVRRQGQDAFRRRIFDAYGGKCCITGCSVGDALEAAHIVAYRGAATNHPQNGILLRADLHKLFDRKLISIDPDSMTVCVAPGLRATDYGSLHGSDVDIPASQSQRPNHEALRGHFLTLSPASIPGN